MNMISLFNFTHYNLVATLGYFPLLTLEEVKNINRENGVNDVTIQVMYCGICHTDLHHVKDDWGITMYPVVPG